MPIPGVFSFPKRLEILSVHLDKTPESEYGPAVTIGSFHRRRFPMVTRALKDIFIDQPAGQFLGIVIVSMLACLAFTLAVG